MDLISKTRQAYKSITGRHGDADITKSIQVAEDLKTLKDNKGFQHVEEFIKRQMEATDQVLDVDLSVITLLSIPKLFNSFLKYLYIIMERRAYRKIKNYIRISIQTGEKYAARRAKAEESKKK